MANIQLGILKDMINRKQPEGLIRDLPDLERRTLSACDTESEKWGLIQDLCNKHRGEAREVHGAWKYVHKPFPDEAEEPKYFHAQYCHTGFEARQRVPWARGGSKGGKCGREGGKGGQKGSNGENTFLARDSKHPHAGRWLREATVTGLPELFATFGHMAMATELYDWWGGARVLVHKRPHGSCDPARREAAIRRHTNAGRWGWGHDKGAMATTSEHAGWWQLGGRSASARSQLSQLVVARGAGRWQPQRAHARRSTE